MSTSKRKREEGCLYGDGNLWCRGPPIGKSRSALVFLATLKKFKRRRRIVADRLRPIMAVKTAGASTSWALMKEKTVLDDLQDCRYIRRIFGAETTVGEGGETACNLLLEYPSGGTLVDLMEGSCGNGLPENRVWHYTKCLLLGLVHLHGRGYVHRNLNPDNIILIRTHSTEFMAKIGDYASVTEIDGRLEKTLWRPYSRTNFEYLSPEACRYGNQGPSSDIWALGCIVYEMLTGQPVWRGRGESEIKEELCKMKNGRGRMKIPCEMSENGREFLTHCFETDAERRWTAERLLRLPFLASFEC